MRYRLLGLIIFIVGFTGLYADEPVRFSASAPTTVILDKPFQLVYSVNATGKDLRAPEITNFEILAGPFESRSSSYQIVNGKATSSVSISYTYTLMAQKTGTFSIPPASIIVDGDKYTSNTLTIKVLPADEQPTEKQSRQTQTSGSSGRISSEDLFIRTTVSKSELYEQEAFLVTYKLYTLVDVNNLTKVKLPDFQGFLKQEIEQSQNKQYSYENYNGKNYATVVLYQALLYPTQVGDIQIDKANFDLIISVKNKAAVRSIFDDFFDSYSNVNRTVTAPATRINVKALPLTGKPASFSGTVGNFSMTANISGQKVGANDAVTIKLNISGSGNMKLIKNPDIKLPDGFETYDPKVVNNFKTTTSGVSGTKSIEYMFIPRIPGKYEIPSAEFSYFDIDTKTYKTLKTPAYKLEVLKGSGTENATVSGTYVNKEDVKQLGEDIRYIISSKVTFVKTTEFLYGSMLGWLMILIPLFISIILFLIFRKNVKDNSNIEYVKNRKANRIATRRLKNAAKLLAEGKKENFYEEVLKAVWLYLSDKLSIPLSSLNKGNVDTELSSKGVEAEIIGRVMEILETCEFARYAPNTGQQEMGNLYKDTEKVISLLEEKIKKKF